MNHNALDCDCPRCERTRYQNTWYQMNDEQMALALEYGLLPESLAAMEEITFRCPHCNKLKLRRHSETDTESRPLCQDCAADRWCDFCEAILLERTRKVGWNRACALWRCRAQAWLIKARAFIDTIFIR